MSNINILEEINTRQGDVFWGKLLVMTEIKQIPWTENKVEPQTYEDLLKVYRAYMHDPEAEFPEEVLEELRKLGKIQ
jgi:hypothetical protein